MRKSICAVLACAVWASALAAESEPELRVANIFSDNMVLQRDRPIRIWGWAKPKQRIRVTLTEDREEAIAKAGEAALARELTEKGQQARERQWAEGKGRPAGIEGTDRSAGISRHGVEDESALRGRQ